MLCLGDAGVLRANTLGAEVIAKFRQVFLGEVTRCGAEVAPSQKQFIGETGDWCLSKRLSWMPPLSRYSACTVTRIIVETTFSSTKVSRWCHHTLEAKEHTAHPQI